MAFNESSIWLRLSFIILVVAVLLQIGGVAAHNWLTSEDVRSDKTYTTGLWQSCIYKAKETSCSTIDDELLPGWFKIVRALSIIGLLLVVAADIITALCAFTVVKSSNKLVYTMAMLLAFAAGACIMLSIIIYGAKIELQDAEFGFSFIFSIISALFSFGSGALLAVGAFINNRNLM